MALAKLAMPAVFIGCWTVLWIADILPSVAFVMSAVIAQAAQIWYRLPSLVVRASEQDGNPGRLPTLLTLFMIILFSVQVWICDVWLTHRLFTLGIAFYICGSIFTLCDKETLDQLLPVSDEDGGTIEFRRHLIKLNTLVAFLILAINETLLVTNTPLGTRVVILSLLPVVFHYFYHVILRLTFSPIDDNQ